MTGHRSISTSEVGSALVAAALVVAVLSPAACSHTTTEPVPLAARIAPNAIVPAGPDGDNVVLRVDVNPTNHSVRVRCSVDYAPTGRTVGSFGTTAELPAGVERTYRLRVPVAFRLTFGSAFVAICTGET